MSAPRVNMEAECQETPDAVRRQAPVLAAPLAALLQRLRRRPPSLVVTCARGSSAHAASHTAAAATDRRHSRDNTVIQAPVLPATRPAGMMVWL